MCIWTQEQVTRVYTNYKISFNLKYFSQIDMLHDSSKVVKVVLNQKFLNKYFLT